MKLALTVAAALVLTACGGGGSSTTTTANPALAAPAADARVQGTYSVQTQLAEYYDLYLQDSLYLRLEFEPRTERLRSWSRGEYTQREQWLTVKTRQNLTEGSAEAYIQPSGRIQGVIAWRNNTTSTLAEQKATVQMAKTLATVTGSYRAESDWRESAAAKILETGEFELQTQGCSVKGSVTDRPNQGSLAVTMTYQTTATCPRPTMTMKGTLVEIPTSQGRILAVAVSNTLWNISELWILRAQ